jgi:hypothetical protein
MLRLSPLSAVDESRNYNHDGFIKTLFAQSGDMLVGQTHDRVSKITCPVNSEIIICTCISGQPGVIAFYPVKNL